MAFLFLTALPGGRTEAGMSSYVPDKDAFLGLAKKGNIVPVYREILADMETPVSAYLKIAGDPYSFLLESVEGGEKWARYCFLGSRPSAVFESKGREVRFTEGGRTRVYTCEDPIDALREVMKKYRPAEVPGLPRFWGGAVGYMSYDMVRFIERLPEKALDDLKMAECCFMITDTMVIFDHVSQRMKVVAMAEVNGGDCSLKLKLPPVCWGDNAAHNKFGCSGKPPRFYSRLIGNAGERLHEVTGQINWGQETAVP